MTLRILYATYFIEYLIHSEIYGQITEEEEEEEEEEELLGKFCDVEVLSLIIMDEYVTGWGFIETLKLVFHFFYR